MIDPWVETYRICGTYQSDHVVTELWVEVTETCGTYQSDRVWIDLWVEVTVAYQADRTGVELWSSGVSHLVLGVKVALAPVWNVHCVELTHPPVNSRVEQWELGQKICRSAAAW